MATAKKTMSKARTKPAAPAGGVDPKLKAVAARAAHLLELAFEKAAAHDERPSKYPLPDGASSAEARAYQVLKDLPLVRRRALKKALMASVEASAPARQRKFADLAVVDLKSKTALMDQVKKLPIPASVRMTAQDIDRASKSIASFFLPARRQGRAAGVHTKLIARIREIKCVEASKQFEIGKDEISVSAVILDDLGNVTVPVPLKAGRFEKGDVLALQHDVYTFNLEGGVFPKTFAVLYAVNEDDVFGAFEKTVFRALVGIVLLLLAMLAAPVLLLSVALLALGGTFLTLALGRGYQVFVRPGDDNAVTFNSAAELTFLDAAGQPSSTSIPVVRKQGVSGGTYQLTTDFVLA
jgi:hypothetical protein